MKEIHVGMAENKMTLTWILTDAWVPKDSQSVSLFILCFYVNRLLKDKKITR